MDLAQYTRLHVRRNSADLHIRTDRQKLGRIISNLVDNAIKYTQSGGVTIDLVERNDRPVIRISDTGIGIPPQSVPQLFDEFYQVNNMERDRAKGFGMGLAICRCLARHIGGDVRLASSSPEGSCFEIILQHNIGQAIGADRRGRPLGEERDQGAAQASGLCSV